MGNICSKGNNKNNNFIHLEIKMQNLEKSNGFFNYKALHKDINSYNIYLNTDCIILLDCNKKIIETFDLVKSYMINNWTIDFNPVGVKYMGGNNLEIYKPNEQEYSKLFLENNKEASKYYLRNIKNDYWFKVDDNASIELELDTIIKIGRLRLKLKKVKLFRENSNKKLYKINDKINTNEDITCRVCWEPESIEYRFFGDCACSRTMPIHGDCLLQWISKNTVSNKKEKYIYIENRHLNCDICKMEYPLFININGKKKLIFDIDLKESYSIFNLYENLTNKLKGIYIIFLKDNTQITLGRNQASDIIFKDLSVSRNHSFLFIKNNKIYLKEDNSKFGTLFYHKNYNIDDKFNIQLDKFSIKGHINSDIHFCCKNKKIKFNNFSSNIKYLKSDELTKQVENFDDKLNMSKVYESNIEGMDINKINTVHDVKFKNNTNNHTIDQNIIVNNNLNNEIIDQNIIVNNNLNNEIIDQNILLNNNLNDEVVDHNIIINNNLNDEVVDHNIIVNNNLNDEVVDNNIIVNNNQIDDHDKQIVNNQLNEIQNNINEIYSNINNIQNNLNNEEIIDDLSKNEQINNQENNEQIINNQEIIEEDLNNENIIGLASEEILEDLNNSIEVDIENKNNLQVNFENEDLIENTNNYESLRIIENFNIIKNNDVSQSEKEISIKEENYKSLVNNSINSKKSFKDDLNIIKEEIWVQEKNENFKNSGSNFEDKNLKVEFNENFNESDFNF